MKSNTLSAIKLVIILSVITLAFLPSTISAKEFAYNKGPSFSITYPDEWKVDPENPWGVYFRVKDDAGLPILDVQILDIPKGVTLEDIGRHYKTEILDKEQKVNAKVASSTLTKLKDGSTQANIITLKWTYQGWLQMQTTILSVYKGNKWVYACINQSDGETPLKDVLYTLKFK